MRKTIVLILILFVALVVYYTNSLLRIKYEQNLNLPDNTKILSVNSLWWIPRTSTIERSVSCKVELSKAQLLLLLKSLDNCMMCNLERIYAGARFSLFPIKYGDVTWIEIIEIKGDFCVLSIYTGYD